MRRGEVEKTELNVVSPDTEEFITHLNARYATRSIKRTASTLEDTPVPQDTPAIKNGRLGTSLLGMPAELIHEIFQCVHPQDLASLSQTCSIFHEVVCGKDNKHLWKAVYLSSFDLPNDVIKRAEFRWEEEAKNQITGLKMFPPLRSNRKLILDAGELEAAAKAVIKLAIDADVSNQTNEQETSRNLQLLRYYIRPSHRAERGHAFIHNSNLYCLVYSKPEDRSRELSQLLAKVHCLAGASYDSTSRRSTLRPTRASTKSITPDCFARARVYDMRLYNTANRWGPWSDDGYMNVDWEKVECIMLDLAYNVELFTQDACTVLDGLWQEPFGGIQRNSYVDQHPKGQPGVTTTEDTASSKLTDEELEELAQQKALIAQDPYGVTGTWHRIVCFLDWSTFNFFNTYSNPPLSEHRAPINDTEATRVILMELAVTAVETIPDSTWPRVYFKGVSRSLHSPWETGAHSRITGIVEMTPAQEVRWSTLSHFQGESRWRSEGVQVGGVKSARGVIGTWFDKDYDDDGPCGPTAFWKVSDSTKLLTHFQGAGPTTLVGMRYFANNDSDESEDEEYEPDVEDYDEDEMETDEEDVVEMEVQWESEDRVLGHLPPGSVELWEADDEREP